MSDPWTTLAVLAITTAVMPVELAITILVLRSPGGRSKAAGWIGGMMVVRLAQYLLLDGVLEQAMDEPAPGPSAVEGALLLVVAVLLLVSAARKLAKQPDEDAPPPRWMTMFDTVSPARAFAMGAGLVALNPKLWAFTLAAIGAIADAGLDTAAGWGAFIAWLLVAQSLHLLALFSTAVAPARAGVVLGQVGDAMERHSRPVMIGLSLVFGVWLLTRALAAFGIWG